MVNNELIIIGVDVKNESPLDRFIMMLYENKIQFKLICNTYEGNLQQELVHSIKINRKLDVKIAKAGIVLFKHNFLNFYFQIKAIAYISEYIDKNKNNYILLPYLHMGDFTPLHVAEKVNENKNCQIWIHTVDPLPSVIGWGEKQIFRKAVVKTIQSAFDKASFFSANNPQMTDYQTKLMKFKGHTFTMYSLSNIVQNSDVKLNQPTENKVVFTYAGSFYGKRTPDQLIYSFASILDNNPNLNYYLEFYGNHSININDFKLSEFSMSRISIHGYVKNIKEILSFSDILIDIDANIKDDVFMSGKIVEYLGFTKPILVISPENSPTNQLFNGKSHKCGVFISDYNIENLKNTIIKVASEIKYPTWDLKERDEVLKLFSPEQNLNIIKEVFNSLK